MAIDSGYFLSRLLKFARTRAGLSQRQLAEKCAVSQPSVVGWENGTRATSEETLAKVGRALGHIDVEHFLCAIVPAWTKKEAQERKQS